MCSPPSKLPTPDISTLLLPAPKIRAPIFLKQFARSTTSGSRAALRITVSPRARVAAIIKFSVAPTEATGSSIRAPLSPFGAFASMYPSFKEICAPSCAIPATCRSTGRGPIAQPPGIETHAYPSRAKSGPRTKMDALIFRTKS